MIAHEWGLTPNEFWSKDLDDQALMIAYIVAKNEMEAYEDRQTPKPKLPSAPPSKSKRAR
jgi:hypothetical protein